MYVFIYIKLLLVWHFSTTAYCLELIKSFSIFLNMNSLKATVVSPLLSFSKYVLSQTGNFFSSPFNNAFSEFNEIFGATLFESYVKNLLIVYRRILNLDRL